MDLSEVIEEVGKVDAEARVFCKDCPKHSNQGHWCSVMAKTVVPNAAACRYGKLVIRAAKVDASRKGIKQGRKCDNRLVAKKGRKGEKHEHQ